MISGAARHDGFDPPGTEGAEGSRATGVGRNRLRRVVVASSLGAVFEAYDLVLFGPMAAIVAARFFSGLDPAYAYVFTLLSAAVTYVARPFGGLVFGRLGDLAGLGHPPHRDRRRDQVEDARGSPPPRRRSSPWPSRPA